MYPYHELRHSEHYNVSVYSGRQQSPTGGVRTTGDPRSARLASAAVDAFCLCDTLLYRLNVCVPRPHVYAETPLPSGMVFGGGLWEVIRMRRGREGEALMDEIRALIRVK